MGLEHGGEQLVLAVEMRVERALGDTGLRGDASTPTRAKPLR
jgi:hypothetical protein